MPTGREQHDPRHYIVTGRARQYHLRNACPVPAFLLPSAVPHFSAQPPPEIPPRHGAADGQLCRLMPQNVAQKLEKNARISTTRARAGRHHDIAGRPTFSSGADRSASGFQNWRLIKMMISAPSAAARDEIDKLWNLSTGSRIRPLSGMPVSDTDDARQTDPRLHRLPPQPRDFRNTSASEVNM